ncbi:RICIN domain-containing protein [Streptomyces sp. NPDC059564]|uniref:RICIN domain-containing protein n=1 Tax=Streptomyces sp. NPDC059564 TaxID=3346865 RepID=UPI0036C86F66
MRKSMVTVVFTLALAGTAAAPATGAVAPDPPNVPAKLVSVNSAKCADVEGWSKDNGAAVHQWSCRFDNDANQRWTFQRSPFAGYWKLINYNSKKCLDVEGPSYADGAKIHQWDCYNGPSQDWRIVGVGDGSTFKLVNRNSNKCMDVEGWSKDDGAKIHQWTCRDVNDANQQWRFSTAG